MERSEMSNSVQSAGDPGANRCSDVATGSSATQVPPWHAVALDAVAREGAREAVAREGARDPAPMARIMVTASGLAALLRMIGRAQERVGDFEAQADVGWLLPFAERMAAEIAAISEDELDRDPLPDMRVQS